MSSLVGEGVGVMQDVGDHVEVDHPMLGAQPLNVVQQQETSGSGRRICQHVNNKGITCQSYEVADGFCRKHGARWRCKREGCSKYAVVKDMCVSHARAEFGDDEVNELRGKALRCKKYPECQLKPAIRGFCLDHARDEYGTEAVEELRQKSRCCKQDGCQKKVVLRGFCTKHAREKFGNEEFDKVHRPLGRCKLEGCEKKAFVRGYCTTHAREHVPREEFDKQYKKLRRCKHADCEKWSVVKGFCISHGAQNKEADREAAEAAAAAAEHGGGVHLLPPEEVHHVVHTELHVNPQVHTDVPVEAMEGGVLPVTVEVGHE